MSNCVENVYVCQLKIAFWGLNHLQEVKNLASVALFEQVDHHEIVSVAHVVAIAMLVEVEASFENMSDCALETLGIANLAIVNPGMLKYVAAFALTEFEQLAVSLEVVDLVDI